MERNEVEFFYFAFGSNKIKLYVYMECYFVLWIVLLVGMEKDFLVYDCCVGWIIMKVYVVYGIEHVWMEWSGISG